MTDLVKQLLTLVTDYAVVKGIPIRFAIISLLILFLVAIMVKWGASSDIELQNLKNTSIDASLLGETKPAFSSYVAKLRESNDSLIFLGISAKRFISEPGMESALVKLAKNGNAVQFYLLNPNSRYLAIKALEEGDTPESWRADIEAGIRRLLDINRKNSININIKIYDDLPLWRAIIIGGTMHVSFFASGKQGIEAPVLVLTRPKDQERQTFFQAFEYHIREVIDKRSSDAKTLNISQ